MHVIDRLELDDLLEQEDQVMTWWLLLMLQMSCNLQADQSGCQGMYHRR